MWFFHSESIVSFPWTKKKKFNFQPKSTINKHVCVWQLQTRCFFAHVKLYFLCATEGREAQQTARTLTVR